MLVLILSKLKESRAGLIWFYYHSRERTGLINFLYVLGCLIYMFIKKNIRRAKLVAKVLYYWFLCMLLNPNNRGFNSYRSSTAKLWLTRIMPGGKNSAVRLLIYGTVINVGFNSWLVRDAKINGLECLAINRGKNVLEAVLIGSGNGIEIVIQNAWKGPRQARVERIREKWFNRPLTAGLGVKRLGMEEQVEWFQKTEKLLRRTIKYLSPLMKQPNKFKATGNYSNTSELARAAENRGLFLARFSNVCHIISPDRAIGLQQSQSSRISTTIRSLTNNKQLTKDFLNRHNIPVPEGRLFTELPAARAYLSGCNGALVVKPVEGSYGKGITMGVRTKEELDSAWHYSKRYHEQVILEEMIHGVDIRVLVIGGKSKAALLRVPANIIGDGKHNIEKLIDSKNKERMANPRLCKALLVPDIYVQSFLERQGFSLGSIPKKEELVFLHFKANIGAGADSIVITDYINPDLLRLAEEAALTLGVNDFWGIDMLVERIDLPRYKQKCYIIEVNSRANIFNVRFPMYGKPCDAAKTLIDHLFPEKVKEQSYSYTAKRIIVTGILGNPFFNWVCEQAKTLSIRGYIKDLKYSVEIIAGGEKLNLYRFIYKLWGWSDLTSGAVDGLKIINFTGKIENDSFVIRNLVDKDRLPIHTKKSNYNFEQENVNTYEEEGNGKFLNSDLDSQLFINQFKYLGYEAKPLYKELLEIKKTGYEGITGMRFSSLFCDEVCEKLQPARVILSLNGIPVIRGLRFEPDEMKKGLNYFKRLNQSCTFNILFKGYVKSIFVTSKKDFMVEWQNATKKGCRHFVIEEHLEGWNLCLAVVAGRTVGALLYKPIEVVGDGCSSISELIDIKNADRKKNPFYHDKIINIDQRLNKILKNKGLQLNDIPVAGEKVVLESINRLELGGETVNLFELLHESFKLKAAEAVEAIPGLKYALVHMIISHPDQVADNQNWAIKKIETSPLAAAFHFPWNGKPYKLVQEVIMKLSLSEDTMWLKEV